jgi:hypothetical protein
MGFSVVAEEVRNLAQQCAEAAQDTSEFLKIALPNPAPGVLWWKRLQLKFAPSLRSLPG